MTKIQTTHVGALPRIQQVVHFIFARDVDGDSPCHPPAGLAI